MLDIFIRSNFNEVIRIQESFDFDFAIIEEVKTHTIKEKTVIGWMLKYGLFQGIEGKERLKIANEFIHFTQNIDHAKELDIESRFARQKLLQITW